MNRRELIQSAIGAAGLGVAGAEIVVDEVVVNEPGELIAVVLKHPGILCQRGYDNLTKSIEEHIRPRLNEMGLDKVPIVVLDEGMTLEALTTNPRPTMSTQCIEVTTIADGDHRRFIEVGPPSEV